MNYTIHIDVGDAKTAGQVLESIEGLGASEVRISTEETFEEMVEQSSLPDYATLPDADAFAVGDSITVETGDETLTGEVRAVSISEDGQHIERFGLSGEPWQGGRYFGGECFGNVVPSLDALERPTPESGEMWYDPYANESWSDGAVSIVEQANEDADSYQIESSKPGRATETVYEANAEYTEVSPSDEVVMGQYADGGTVYAFPAARLLPVCGACGPIERSDMAPSGDGWECRICGTSLSV